MELDPFTCSLIPMDNRPCFLPNCVLSSSASASLATLRIYHQHHYHTQSIICALLPNLACSLIRTRYPTPLLAPPALAPSWLRSHFPLLTDASRSPAKATIVVRSFLQKALRAAVVSSSGSLNGSPHQLNNHPPHEKKDPDPLILSFILRGEEGGDLT